ncbi:putative arabinose efflux permease, MFS family [Prauserella aidingensis]|uniref:MFS transporter n=1 Tax=Prauserella aidingensis TaxID=387890 RepID=UPI0020A27583|nr:MFS transporter [Prauserella aidingensis]MCP2252080.1 putative arabinose efflux permease, MFS family [Prauserella aidingensis]
MERLTSLRRPVSTSPAGTGAYVLVVLTFGAYLPSTLYPAYQRVFGIDDLTMTVVYATFALVSAPALLLFGQATDALGARPVLRGALVVAAAGSACFVAATDTGWLLAGRAAQGLALGAATAAASALTSLHGGRRIAPAALAGIAFVGGTAAGPVVGGVLARHAPAPETLPFALHLALLAIGWRLVSRLGAGAPGMTVTAGLARWRPTKPKIPRGMRRVFASAAAAGFLAWTVAGLFLAIIPTLLDRAGQANPAVTGAILGLVLVCSVATQPLVGRLSDRRAQVMGLGALLTSLALLAVTAGASTTVTLVAAVIAGAGHGLAYGGASAAVDAVAPVARKGAITGALHVAFYLGSGAPAVLVGLITLAHPLAVATTWVTAAAAAAVPLVAAAVVGFQRRAYPVRRVRVWWPGGLRRRGVGIRRGLGIRRGAAVPSQPATAPPRSGDAPSRERRLRTAATRPGRGPAFLRPRTRSAERRRSRARR